jgi:hypothetical protein
LLLTFVSALALFYIPKFKNNELLYPIGAVLIGFELRFYSFYFLGKSWPGKLTG